MNNKEFLNEAIASIQDVYKRFETYQQMVWDILLEFDRVCRKNDINYWLCYGTLIGAVRDGGQIPWDYDVDVVMFLDDRQRLIDALESDLSDDFYYTYSNNCHNYLGGNSLLRICRKGYAMVAIHVDVFFLMGAVNNDKKMKRHHSIMTRIKHVYDIKYAPLEYEDNPMNKLQRIKTKLYKCLYSIIPLSLLNRVELKYLSKYPVKELVCIPYFGVVVPAETFNTKYVEINNRKLPIPSGYDILLKKIYGNYHKYFPIESRIQEFERHVSRIEYEQNRIK